MKDGIAVLLTLLFDWAFLCEIAYHGLAFWLLRVTVSLCLSHFTSFAAERRTSSQKDNHIFELLRLWSLSDLESSPNPKLQILSRANLELCYRRESFYSLVGCKAAIWGIVKIMIPFSVPIIIRGLI